MHIYVYVHDFLLQVTNLMKPESFQEVKCFYRLFDDLFGNI